MNKKFILSALVTTVVLFILNAIVYVAFLKDFFHSHPAISTDFMNQLYRPDDQIIGWAVIACSIALGVLVTTVINWSGARNFSQGLRKGFNFAILFLLAVDLGLLGTTNNFTTEGAFADIICSTITVTLSSAIAALMLGRGGNN